MFPVLQIQLIVMQWLSALTQVTSNPGMPFLMIHTLSDLSFHNYFVSCIVEENHWMVLIAISFCFTGLSKHVMPWLLEHVLWNHFWSLFMMLFILILLTLHVASWTVPLALDLSFLTLCLMSVWLLILIVLYHLTSQHLVWVEALRFLLVSHYKPVLQLIASKYNLILRYLKLVLNFLFLCITRSVNCFTFFYRAVECFSEKTSTCDHPVVTFIKNTVMTKFQMTYNYYNCSGM